MALNKNEPANPIGDLKLTGTRGEKLLVNAFDIALVSEQNGYTTLTLKIPVTGGGSTSRVTAGLSVDVKETRDEIADMRMSL